MAFQGKRFLGNFLSYKTRGPNGTEAYISLKDLDNKHHLYTSDGKLGPFDNLGGIRYLDGFSYYYLTGAKYYYSINGKINGPYISKPRLVDGQITVSQRINGKLCTIIRKVPMSRTYGRFAIDSRGNYIAFNNYSPNWHQPGIVLNGKELPDENYLHIFYDTRDDSFKWFTLDGRSIVIKAVKF